MVTTVSYEPAWPLAHGSTSGLGLATLVEHELQIVTPLRRVPTHPPGLVTLIE
jgi:hypothetical protein